MAQQDEKFELPGRVAGLCCAKPGRPPVPAPTTQRGAAPCGLVAEGRWFEVMDGVVVGG